MEGDQAAQGRRLPNAERAFIEPAKLTEYLLNPDHPVGGDKAAFLTRFGFHRDSWTVLEVVLLAHAIEGEVVREREEPYGRLFTVEGRLVTPDRRNPIVRTVWMLAFGEDQPRFITAYPAGRRRRGGAP